MVLNAAILLEDGSPLALARTKADIEALLAQEKPAVDPKALGAATAAIGSGRLPFQLSAALSKVLELEKARQGGKLLPANDALLGLQQALKAAKAELSRPPGLAPGWWTGPPRPASWASSSASSG